MMGPTTYHFFVYRISRGKPYDDRCPIGGVVVTAWRKKTVPFLAYEAAELRFPCRPHELLVLRHVADTMDVCHAALMARDWERSFAEFEELMGVER